MAANELFCNHTKLTSIQSIGFVPCLFPNSQMNQECDFYLRGSGAMVFLLGGGGGLYWACGKWFVDIPLYRHHQSPSLPPR